MTYSIPEFVIIADDLTGSLDTGLQFRKKGLTTVVPLSLARPWPKAQALVLNTDSRNIPGDVAYKKVYQACRHLKSKALYKKIDSTFCQNFVSHERESVKIQAHRRSLRGNSSLLTIAGS